MSILEFRCPVSEILVGDIHVEKNKPFTKNEPTAAAGVSMRKLAWEGISGFFQYRQTERILIRRDSDIDTAVSLVDMRDQLLRSDVAPLPAT